jgi:hypothetical protein
MTAPAWYFGTREDFLATSKDSIADQLAGRAASEDLEIESYQNQEWRSSIDLLQKALDERVPILREALLSPQGKLIRYVILEFDFRRRGLRMDCLLLADGVLFVVEFKRNKLQASDRDQVMTYAVNLLEFHAATQTLSEGEDGIIVVPVLTLTEGLVKKKPRWPGLGGHSWHAAANHPLESDAHSLAEVFELAFDNRRSDRRIDLEEWLRSPFRPSSSILDATLSLYGNHDVSAISEHAAPAEEIKSSVVEIREVIEKVLSEGSYHVVFLSGAPGAGKTLVGLELVLRGNHAGESVFVTGNAPLVEVLNKALAQSFRSQSKSAVSWAHTGYRREDARFVTSTANYKIVKAHNFLGKRTENHRQEDGRVLVFDEAQRTYEKGKMVLREKLPDHEADLILETQKKAYPDGGAVVVALIGHNQAINGGEMGILAWLEAIERKGWSFSISDQTLDLAEIKDTQQWGSHERRSQLQNGHLSQSMRYYRNSEVEQWAGCVLNGDVPGASFAAGKLEEGSDCIWITRSLAKARKWAKKQTVGTQRCGLIASGQARRLAAEGLFVELKPSIADWMLAPSTDVRSSNALEAVQNQFQVQGLELDFCVVCWDADLRREGEKWTSFKLSGSKWQKDALLEVAKNSYRVLLTRARKGMIIFVPQGDLSGEDDTRIQSFYDGIWDFLRECGAKELDRG